MILLKLLLKLFVYSKMTQRIFSEVFPNKFPVLSPDYTLDAVLTKASAGQNLPCYAKAINIYMLKDCL